MMLLYIGVGAGVAATRVFLSLLGVYRYERTEALWPIAKSMTDVLWWPLVLLVLFLHLALEVMRVQHR